jgi:hypothetical protein
VAKARSLPSAAPGEVASLIAPTAIGLTLPPNLPFADWRYLGLQLGHTRSAMLWAIGDWFRHGRNRYGIQKLTALEDWDRNGLSYQRCFDLAWVAGAFPVSRRREKISFSAHQEVAGLEPADADRLLDWVEEDPTNIRSTRELRKKVKELREEEELEEARRRAEEKAEQEAARQREEKTPAAEDNRESATVTDLAARREQKEASSEASGAETEQESDEEPEQLSVHHIADTYREVWDKTRAAVQTIGRIRAQGYLVAKGRHDVSPAEAMRELDDAIQKLKDFRWSVIHDKDK